MKSLILESVKKRVNNWWVSLLIGILAIILAVLCIAVPDITLVAMTYVFIIAFFISGIIEIVFAVSNRDVLHGWGWSLSEGIIDIVFGILLLIIPQPVMTVLFTYLVGIWILFRSIGTIADSFELQQLEIKGWGWFLALAILGIIFSIFFILSPVIFKGAFIVAFVFIALLIYGIFKIVRAFKLRSIKKDIREIKEYFS